MPRRDGFEAAAKIRAVLPGVLLVAITGLTLTSKQDATAFDHYVLKPADIDYLIGLLSKRQAAKPSALVAAIER
jgi:CheY-like chemotaxis protein